MITVTTTLPDKVVDYRNEDARDLRFQSDKLKKMTAQVTCCYSYYADEDQPDVPQEKQTLIQKIVAHVRAVFEKFFALFRRIFGLQSADAAPASTGHLSTLTAGAGMFPCSRNP